MSRGRTTRARQASSISLDFWARNDSQQTHQDAANEPGLSHAQRAQHLGYLTGDHVDVWNGQKQGSDGNGDGTERHDYFERSREVWFWPLH